jgi:hypothetical protein
MIRRLLKPIVLGLLLGSFWLGLTGCSHLKAKIPQHIVAAAVALQAQADQATLWQQLSSSSESAPSLSVSRVKVHRVRSVQVAADLAYEVTGTYQYKLRYPNRPTVKQSQVPFDVILQGDTEPDDWRLLQRGPAVQGDRAWQWQPLKGDRA